MNPQTHMAIDGYVEAIPDPGTGWGTARFDLIHSLPTRTLAFALVGG